MYESFALQAYVFDATDDIRARIILETDGVESELFNGTTFVFDTGGDYGGVQWSDSISMNIAGEVVYSNFWTFFNKTRENPPA